MLNLKNLFHLPDFIIEGYALCILILNTLQGCTATVLLVWTDGDENFFAQCANVGDSACVMKYVSLLFCNFCYRMYG